MAGDDTPRRPAEPGRVQGRPDTPAMGDEVSPVELLFDLVFVFAISQLSEHLLDRLDWRGALETVVLLLAVFGIWSLASFGASMPGIRRRTEIATLLTVLLLGLFFNAGITSAFEPSPWLFVVPFLACSTGIILFYVFATSSPVMRSHGRSMVVWALPSLTLWITGALADPDTRVWWWAAAALLDVTGAWAAHPLPGRLFHTEAIAFAPAHMIERSRLFLIIALGETVLTTGSALSQVRVEAATVLAGVCAVVGTVALWALYFTGSGRFVSEHASTTGDPLRAARLAVNGQVVTAAGLIVLAVGYEIAIEEPLDSAGPVISLLLFGGPLLYLGHQAWYLRALSGRLPRSRMVGAGVLALVGAGAWALPAVCALAASSLVIALLAVRVSRDSAHGHLAGPDVGEGRAATS